MNLTIPLSACAVFEDRQVAYFWGIPARFRTLINLNNLILLSSVDDI